MSLLRVGLVVVLCLGGAVACTPGGPQRASGLPNSEPMRDARENPLTPTLSPQGRGEGATS